MRLRGETKVVVFAKVLTFTLNEWRSFAEKMAPKELEMFLAVKINWFRFALFRSKSTTTGD